MLKRHSKMVVLLVLVTFLFSFTASAGATTFTDVTGTGAQSAAVYKLNSLGIIDGYTDGTFKPANTITRAEFAKIAGYLAGLGTVAEGMQSAPSTFKDVKTTDWFNGAVNLAFAQGYVKGYPDGTFKPNAAVTQAEVVTVFMRILGYNDNLPGNWPADYISKAANLGVLDDVTFASNVPATRGIVAIIGAATLDENVVSYKASDNVFEEAKKNDLPYTLLSDKFKDAAANNEVLVTAVEVGSDSYTFDTYDFEVTGDADGVAITGIEFADDVVVSGAPSIFALEGAMINYIMNDDDEVTFVEVRDVKAPVFGAIDSISGNKIEINSVKHELNEGFFFTSGKVADSGYANDLTDAVTPSTGVSNDAIDDFVTVDAKVKLFFDEDGKIVFISKTGVGRTLVVKSVDTKNGKIKTETDVTVDGMGTDDDYVVLKNGAVKSLADVKAGDLIYASVVRGFDRVITIVDAPVNGKLERYYANSNEVVIAGKTYDVAAVNGNYGLYLVDSAGDEIDAGDLVDLVGSDVTAKLDGNGEVAYISGATTDNGALYGIIIDAGYETGRDDTGWIKLANKEGKQLDLDFESDYWDDEYAKADAANAIEVLVGNVDGNTAIFVGKLIKYELNAAGEVSQVKPAVTVTSNLQSSYDYTTAYAIPTEGEALDVDDPQTDHDRLLVDGTWRYVDKNTVIWDADYDGTDIDPELATWADIEDADNKVRMDVYYDGTDIEYIVVFELNGISDSGNKGVFVDSYDDGEDDWLTFIFDGAVKEFKGTDSSYTPGFIYNFEINDDNADNIAEATNVNATGDTVTANTEAIVSDIDGDVITLNNGESYTINDDTMFVKMDGNDVDEVGEFGDLDEGDYVYVLEDGDAEDAGFASIIVILDK